MDRVFYFSSWQPGLCVLALTFMDSFLIDQAGKGEGTDHQELVLSVLLIGTNIGILGLCVFSADHIRRLKTKAQVEALFDQIEALEGEDKSNYDEVWADYVAEAPEGAEAALYEKLRILVEKRKGAVVVQPPALSTVDALLEASHRHNSTVHDYLGAIMAECGGAS